MTSDSKDRLPAFNPNGPNAYSGYNKTTVPTYDPELAETDPGTPMGEYMRRFWHPVCLAEELTDVPRPIRILGEDLVAFRDRSGAIGVLHRHCAHRGTSLEYGIIQESGIRCCYHGFEYSVDGTLMKAPGEVDGGKRLAKSVSQGAYPAFERFGTIWAYMGPFDEMPAFPEWEFFDTYEDSEVVPYCNIYPCNWLQVMDNIPDQIHTSQLHHASMRVISDDDDGTYPATSFNPTFTQHPFVEYTPVRGGSAMVFTAGRRVGKDKIWVRQNDAVLPNITVHANTSEDGRDVRYFHRVHQTRWYVPVDNENSIVFGLKMFGPTVDPFDSGDKSKCGYDSADFLVGQTGNRPRSEAQRMPGDWDAVTSQRPIAVHAMENPTHEDRGVFLNRLNLRRAVRGENPDASPAAVHARANAGLRDRVYTNNTILEIPRQDGRDDEDLIREACKKVLEVCEAGDAYEGEERRLFIENALKDYERSFATAAAAE